MNGLIVYHSKYGNGKLVAEALAEGLKESGHEAKVLEAGAADSAGASDFVVVSSPTRAGRMMGPAKHFIHSMDKDAWKDKPFIAVGTGFRPKGTGKLDEMGAKSADKVFAALEKAGLKPLMDAQKFYVADMKGPLEDGEIDRAAEVGRDAGRRLTGMA
jgi:flavodoxin